MTKRNFINDVKKINNRLSSLVKHLGTLSNSYSKVANSIKTVIPEQFLTYDKNGAVQIRRPASLYQENNVGVIKEIGLRSKDTPTWKGIAEEHLERWKENKRIEKELFEEGFSDEYEEVSLEDFIKSEESIYEALTTLYDNENKGYSDVDEALDTMRTKDRKKTYKELISVINTGERYVI